MLGLIIIVYAIYVLAVGKMIWSKKVQLFGSEARGMAMYFLALAFFLMLIAPQAFPNSSSNLFIQVPLTLGMVFVFPYLYVVIRDIFSKSEKKAAIESEAYMGWEIFKTIAGVALFVVFFRYFVIQPFYIIGNSMNPDFLQGEYLFIDEASYYLRAPARGEVVVFKHPETGCTEFVEQNKLWSHIAQGPCTSYIKRVIGLPGETVILKSGKFTVKNTQNPSGITLNENYIEPGVTTLGDQTVTLAKDEYFVVGDNRKPNQSYDSRQWGPLKRDYITGKAWLRLLPVDKLGFISKAKY